MVLNYSHLKNSRFGIMLYGIPFLGLLILQLIPSSRSTLNPVQNALVFSTSISLFVISTLLGGIVDTYFRSDPRASVPKVLFIGTFTWSFLLVAVVLSASYLAFRAYDANHHTNLMPLEVFSSWSTSLDKFLVGTILGGVFFLPLNGLFIFLVRRRYINQVSASSHP